MEVGIEAERKRERERETLRGSGKTGGEMGANSRRL